MSKLLDELNQLRKNLDKNDKKYPDYHINTKVVVDDKPKTQTVSGPIVTENAKKEIRGLFQYGLNLNMKLEITFSGDKNKKYEIYRFRDKSQLVDTLTEYTRGASRLIFLVDNNLW